MAGTVEKKLADLGITLPTPAAPVANYVPFVRTGNLLVSPASSASAPTASSRQVGKLGGGVSVEDGAEGGARLRHQSAGPDQGRARRSRQGAARGPARRLHQCGAGLPDGPKVMNGASDLMVDGVRRQGPPCPHHHRRRRAAARRRGRGRGHVRGVLNADAGLTGSPRGRSRIAACMTRAAGVVENTASAFSAAIAGGYAIECDVQLSADGEAMVHHDFALGRLTDGSARARRHDAPPAQGGAASRRPPTACMTLGELCDLVAGRVTAVIEIKSRFDGDLRLARRAAEVLEGYTRARPR